MAGANWLQAFFTDFAANPNALRAMGYSPTDQRLTLLQQEAGLENVHIWTEAAPASGDWEAIKAHVNRHIAQQEDDYATGNFTSLHKDDTRNEYVAGTYNGRIIVLDDDLSFKRYLGRRGYASSADDTNIYIMDARVSPDGSRLAICNYLNHVVRVYDYTNGDLNNHLFDIGTFGSSAVFDGTANTVYHPISVDFLPNGNIAVASYDGRATDGSYTAGASGYIAEFDGATGAPVGLLAWDQRGTNGEPWLGGFYRPVRIRIIEDGAGGYELWASSIDYANNNFRDYIAVFDATNAGQLLPYKSAYREPVGYPFAYLSARDFLVDRENNRLVIVSRSNRCIVVVGLDDRELKAITGFPNFTDTNARDGDRYKDEPIPPLGFHDPIAIAPVFDDTSGNKVWVANYANNVIQGGYLEQTVSVPVNVTIPAGYELKDAFLPKGFNADAATWEVSINNLNDVKPFAVPMVRSYT